MLCSLWDAPSSTPKSTRSRCKIGIVLIRCIRHWLSNCISSLEISNYTICMLYSQKLNFCIIWQNSMYTWFFHIYFLLTYIDSIFCFYCYIQVSYGTLILNIAWMDLCLLFSQYTRSGIAMYATGLAMQVQYWVIYIYMYILIAIIS